MPYVYRNEEHKPGIIGATGGGNTNLSGLLFQAGSAFRPAIAPARDLRYNSEMRGPATVCLFFAVCLFLTPARILARAGSADPVFADVGFDQWFQQGTGTRIHWTAVVADPLLSTHQRLFSRTVMKVGGEELARRRGKGKLLLMIQIADNKGDVWQYHSPLDLESIPEGARPNDYQYIQPFFVLPGKYAISLAVYDTATREHSIARRKLHVSQLRDDPLRGAWNSLPAVEFLDPCDPPDTWFLPLIRGRLHLPVMTRHPVQIDVFVNLTPTDRFAGSARIQDLNLAALIPVLKLLSEVAWSDARVNIEMLDLSRNKVVFSQENVRDIDWGKARGRLAETAPGVIDLKSLENHKHSADFFTTEIRRRIGLPVSGRNRAVIVLSSGISFRPEVELHPVEDAPRPDMKVLYLRYQMPRQIAMGRGGRGEGPAPARFGPVNDQLEPLLKGLNPQLFDVTTTGQFRRALARIFDGVAVM